MDTRLCLQEQSSDIHHPRKASNYLQEPCLGSHKVIFKFI